MRKAMLCKLCALCMIAGCLNLTAAVLIKDKIPEAGIIIDPAATKSAQFATMELQYHIEKMTGVKLPVSSDPSNVKGTRIFVGESAFTREKGFRCTDFKNQEYLVKVDGSTIILMGRDKEDFGKVDYKDDKTFPSIWDECATSYAVYDFLETLGVRWYLPTDIGITFTPSSSLAVSDMEIRRAPYMKFRRILVGEQIPEDFAGDTVKTVKIGKISNKETALWRLRQRLGGNFIYINHSFYAYYNRFWPAKPELFAKGYDEKQPSQLCYSNPETIKQVVQDANDYFNGLKNRVELCGNIPYSDSVIKTDVFPLVPMDNRLWCKCPACQSQVTPKPQQGAGQFSNDQASEYMFSFVNKVAKEIGKTHPDKYVGAAAYAAYCYPPKELEPNVMIMMCTHSRMVYAPDIMQNDRAILKAWGNAFPENFKLVWMYWCFPTEGAVRQKWRCFPPFFAHHVKKYMKEFVVAGVRGIQYQPSFSYFSDKSTYTRCYPLFDQVEGYINWKLADDPSLDADVLFDEFFDRYYGNAAEPMRQFYLLVENTFCDTANYPVGTKHQTSEIAWGNLGTEKRMKKLKEFIEAAETAATSEPFKTRVGIFKKGIWDYMQKGREAFLKQAGLMTPTMQHTTAVTLPNRDPGNPLTAPWEKAGYVKLQYGDMQAGKAVRDLDFRICHDGKYLYLLYEENNIDPEKLYIDGILWKSDEWESFFAKQRGEPYRQLGVDATGKYVSLNLSGTVRDGWDLKGEIVSKKEGKAWKTYIAIPLDDLVEGGINPGETLYYNLIRSGQEGCLGCWVPTFSGYHAPGRFGEIYLEK